MQHSPCLFVTMGSHTKLIHELLPFDINARNFVLNLLSTLLFIYQTPLFISMKLLKEKESSVFKLYNIICYFQVLEYECVCWYRILQHFFYSVWCRASEKPEPSSNTSKNICNQFLTGFYPICPSWKLLCIKATFATAFFTTSNSVPSAHTGYLLN